MPLVTVPLMIEWMAPFSFFGFAAMGVDKLLAVGRRGRISERTLWSTALVGGFLGIFVGGFVFHHKTSKAEFWAPVVISAVLWAALALLLPRAT
jgi:uncharacterized membrane protein YsdA (DUF1294 family)